MSQIPPNQSHIKKSKKSLINFRATRDNFMSTADSSGQQLQQQPMTAGYGSLNQSANPSYSTEPSAVEKGRPGVAGIVTTNNTGQINFNSNSNHISQISMVSAGHQGNNSGSRQSSTGARGQHQYKMSTQQSQLQLQQANDMKFQGMADQHQNVMSYQQIDTSGQNNFNSQPLSGAITGTNNQNKRNISNNGRINFGAGNNQMANSQNKPKFKQMLTSQGSSEMMTAPQSMMG